MIKSFKDKRVEKLYQGEHVREFSGFDRQARKRLRILNQARVLSDVAALPGNHLEPLKGNREGQHSIRINDQWRICFIWTDAPEDVEIVDYH